HAASAPTDFGVDDARAAITAKLGETGGSEDVDSILKGQGWQPGDRYVGEAGLQGVFKNLDANAAKRQAGAAPAALGAPAPATAPGPTAMTTSAAGGGADGDVYARNYSSGSNLNNSGKNKFT